MGRYPRERDSWISDFAIRAVLGGERSGVWLHGLALLKNYAYSPYGEATTLGPDGGNSLQYTGRENDQTGLYYYRARYYDSVLKRFISEDPIGLEAGPNFYAYVGGNPISRIDPTGEADVRIENAMRAAGMPIPKLPPGVLDEQCFAKCVVLGKAAASATTTVVINQAAKSTAGTAIGVAAQGAKVVASHPATMTVSAAYGLDYCWRNCRKEPDPCPPPYPAIDPFVP